MRSKNGERVADFDAADSRLAATLESLDDAPNYRDWILSLLRPWAKHPILEVGAGHGTFTEVLEADGPITACEPSPRAAALLRERFAGSAIVTVEDRPVEALASTPAFGTAMLINVLEHIEDDEAMLAALRERLTDGGRLVLWVPAFPLLYSAFDRTIGHHRRYRRRGLVDLVERSGFDIDVVHHANLPGFFSWLLVARVFGRAPTDARAVRVYDRFMIPLIRRMEQFIRPPFGQSIFLVATRKQST